jgi:hypothetical protein
VNVQACLKVARFLLVAAAVPAAAQSGFVHGHKLGNSVAYLEDSGDVRNGSPISLSLTDGAGKASPATIVITRADGSAVLVGTGPGGSPRPCVTFEAWAEQTSTDFAESTNTGVAGVQRSEGKVVIQRFVRDDLRQIYASYAVTVETLPEGTYRLSFGPPEPRADMSGKAGWKVLSPSKYPVPQVLRAEDSVRIELYSNGTTRRVVDYVHAGRQEHLALRKESPHDYYADDAELTATRPRVRVNGVMLARDAAAVMPETIRGPVLWVYFPGYGRYVLSLHGHPDLGFEDTGEAAGNSLAFSAEGNVFRIEGAERIAAGSGNYIVHVLPDREWMPADPQDRARVMIGASLGVIGAP